MTFYREMSSKKMVGWKKYLWKGNRLRPWVSVRVQGENLWSPLNGFEPHLGSILAVKIGLASTWGTMEAKEEELIG